MARRIIRIDPAMSRRPEQRARLLMITLFPACGQQMFCAELGRDRDDEDRHLLLDHEARISALKRTHHRLKPYHENRSEV